MKRGSKTTHLAAIRQTIAQNPQLSAIDLEAKIAAPEIEI
jgi:hypothetical protein